MVEDLTCRYGAIAALDSVSFALAPGDFRVVLGPNGAGKSTLIRTIARLARPAAGRIRMNGEDWLAAPATWQREVGVLSHETFLYDGLTALENLCFHARLFGLTGGAARGRAALAAAGLAELADRRAGTLSGGQAQRLAIARALLHEPSLLLLDEPFAGLDSRAAERLADTLSSLAAAGRTILLTTHDLARIPAAATGWLFLVRGRVRGEGSLPAPAGALALAYERALSGAPA